MTSKLDTAGLVERGRYMVGNPSAWDSFDQGASDIIRDLIEALTQAAAPDMDCECCFGTGLQADGETPCPCVASKALLVKLSAMQERAEGAEQHLRMIAATADGGHANGHWHGVCYNIAMEYLMGRQAKLSEKDHATINRNLPGTRAALAHKGEGR